MEISLMGGNTACVNEAGVLVRAPDQSVVKWISAANIRRTRSNDDEIVLITTTDQFVLHPIPAVDLLGAEAGMRYIMRDALKAGMTARMDAIAARLRIIIVAIAIAVGVATYLYLS